MNIDSVTQKTIDYVKPIWKNFSHTDSRRIFLPFKVHNKNQGDVFVSIGQTANNGFGYFKTTLVNSENINLGHELLFINPENRANMVGFDIFVFPNFRKKNRLGELLRLASIMEMMENKSSSMSIHSVDSAVYFHSKYKFEPAITSFEIRNRALDTISSDISEGFEDFALRAKKIIADVEKNKANAAVQRALCSDTNVLVKDYIDQALKDGKPEVKHPFNWGIDMILTKDKIVQCKDYFNSLFEQHAIDYRI